MADLVSTLKDVPAGVWTFLVAILGFGFTGWSNRQASKEREAIRAHQDSKDTTLIQHNNAQHWRELRLEAIDKIVNAFTEFMAAFEQATPDFKDDAVEERLRKAALACRQAGLAMEVRATAKVVRLERQFVQYLFDVLFDVSRWKDLENQPEVGQYSQFTSFTATHHYHDTLSIASNNLNQLLEACRQDLGIIEYQLPELQQSVTGETYGTLSPPKEEPL